MKLFPVVVEQGQASVTVEVHEPQHTKDSGIKLNAVQEISNAENSVEKDLQSEGATESKEYKVCY